MHFNDEVVENVAESIVTIITKWLIPFGEILLFRILLTYNECLALLQIASWYLKRECYAFTLLSDFLINVGETVVFISRYILGYFLHSYMEPFYPNWICVIEMGNVVNKDPALFFVEQYSKVHIGHDTNECNVAMHLFNKKYTQQQSVSTGKYESLVLMRLHGDYIVRIANQSNPTPTLENNSNANTVFKQSSVEFLSVLYSHPTTMKLVEIRLPTEMYKVGNQLLSISHVWRCVAYSSLFTNIIQFDDKYKLYIIDHNAMRVELGADEYVVIEEDNYKIMKQQK